MMNDSVSVDMKLSVINSVSRTSLAATVSFMIFLKQLESSPMFCSQLNATATDANNVIKHHKTSSHGIMTCMSYHVCHDMMSCHVMTYMSCKIQIQHTPQF